MSGKTRMFNEHGKTKQGNEFAGGTKESRSLSSIP